MQWPPTLDELKDDVGVELSDTRDDSRLQRVLDAAVEFVRRVHAGRYNFDLDPVSELKDPATSTLPLGTIRLAVRWHIRRRSPDALIEMAELGASRVPSFDPDIDRLLRVGRHGMPRIG